MTKGFSSLFSNAHLPKLSQQEVERLIEGTIRARTRGIDGIEDWRKSLYEVRENQVQQDDTAHEVAFIDALLNVLSDIETTLTNNNPYHIYFQRVQEAILKYLIQQSSTQDNLDAKTTEPTGTKTANLRDDVVERLINNTVKAKTNETESRAAWYWMLKAEQAQYHQQEGWKNEISLLDALLALLDNRELYIAEENPYYDRIIEGQEQIRDYQENQQSNNDTTEVEVELETKLEGEIGTDEFPEIDSNDDEIFMDSEFVADAIATLFPDSDKTDTWKPHVKLPQETLDLYIRKTVIVKAVLGEFETEWREMLENDRKQYQELGRRWHDEVDFFNGLIAILDNSPFYLPAGNIYQPLLTWTQSEAEWLKDVIYQTMVVITREPDKQSNWKAYITRQVAKAKTANQRDRLQFLEAIDNLIPHEYEAYIPESNFYHTAWFVLLENIENIRKGKRLKRHTLAEYMMNTMDAYAGNNVLKRENWKARLHKFHELASRRNDTHEAQFFSALLDILNNQPMRGMLGNPYREEIENVRKTLSEVPLMEAIQALTDAKSWEAARQVYQTYETLLSLPEAEAILQEKISEIDDDKIREKLEVYLERIRMVKRVKHAGIEAAFMENPDMNEIFGSLVRIYEEHARNQLLLAYQEGGEYAVRILLQEQGLDEDSIDMLVEQIKATFGDTRLN